MYSPCVDFSSSAGHGNANTRLFDNEQFLCLFRTLLFIGFHVGLPNPLASNHINHLAQKMNPQAKLVNNYMI
jgi:hypothetical protein